MTREIGDLPLDRFALCFELFPEPTLVLVFAGAGFFATTFGDRFAVPRLAVDVPFFALFLPTLADRFAIFGRFAADFFPPRVDVEALRALVRLPPDVLRDFLARAAMILLLGVGGDS